MKKYLLIITFFLGLSVNGQYALMSAVDLNDGAEDDYLKLEKFWSAVHEEAIDQELQTGWSVWKRTPQDDRHGAYSTTEGGGCKRWL